MTPSSRATCFKREKIAPRHQVMITRNLYPFVSCGDSKAKSLSGSINIHPVICNEVKKAFSTEATWHNEKTCFFIKSRDFGFFQPKPLDLMKKLVSSLSRLALVENFNRSHVALRQKRVFV
jgi:hypothetical protein